LADYPGWFVGFCRGLFLVPGFCDWPGFHDSFWRV
jgi:hypothetical protein